MEDNNQEARKRKAQAEANLQRKIDDTMDVMQVKLALAELMRRGEQLQKPMSSSKTFEDFDLHFDDPTDEIMEREALDGGDELSVESGRRSTKPRILKWN